ncbi:protein of unknown function [Nitrospira defluvii]|uniref:Uncharacterized protein n=1 Tax=Nitrospira defluvii TaxID=330214 RepID=D8PBU7_9BACT|nr:protein of unknown function [Nitrospira defluvii]
MSAAFRAMLPQQRTLTKHFQQRRQGRIGFLRGRYAVASYSTSSTRLLDAGLSPHPR